MAIQIAQRIEAPDYIELPPSTQLVSNNHHKQPNDSSISPMDIDVKNAQFTKKSNLLNRDSQGKPRCFYWGLSTQVEPTTWSPLNAESA